MLTSFSDFLNAIEFAFTEENGEIQADNRSRSNKTLNPYGFTKNEAILRNLYKCGRVELITTEFLKRALVSPFKALSTIFQAQQVIPANLTDITIVYRVHDEN